MTDLLRRVLPHDKMNDRAWLDEQAARCQAADPCPQIRFGRGVEPRRRRARSPVAQGGQCDAAGGARGVRPPSPPEADGRALSDAAATAAARKFCVAPMMDWTDRHCRAFHRALTRRALLYTEMVTTGAVLHGDRERLLGFDPVEHPVALQLGGSEPGDLARAARIAEDLGYDEVNLNVGCPSDRVQSGRFGACLMREPELVAECLAEMRAAVAIPVTLKCRLGVDDQDPEESLWRLVDLCAQAGTRTVVVHARKAWLKGLSPKENRDVPPLDYALVARLKHERPTLEIILNGGLTLETALDELHRFDGVMLGRAAYHEPALLGRVDALVFGEGEGVDAFEAVERHRPYLARRLEEGVHLSAMTRHMLGLMHGRAGARSWRRILTVEAIRPGAGLEVLDRALEPVMAKCEHFTGRTGSTLEGSKALS